MDSPKTMRTVLAIAGVVALLCCGAGMVTALKTTGTTTTRQKARAKGTATMGAQVRDGKFEFIVTRAECGVSKVGTAPLTKTAHGQFCLVHLRVTNISTGSRTFYAADQLALGTGDVRYSCDETASLYASEDTRAFLNDINPGNSIAATVVFDIPAAVQLSTVELHDSGFSGGARVSVAFP